MSTQKNLITLCCAAVFTLGLAACGGGGGGGPVEVGGGGPPSGMNGDGMNGDDDTRSEADILADALTAEAMAQATYDALVAEGAMVDPAALGAAFLALQQATAAVEDAEALADNQETLARAIKVAGAIVIPEDGTSPVVAYSTAVFTVDGGKITDDDNNDDNNYAAVTDGMVAKIADWPGSMSMATRMADDAGTMDENEQVTHTVVSYTDRAPNAAALYSAYYDAADGAVPDGHIARRGVESVSALVLTLRDDVTDASRPLFGATDFGITARNQNLTVVDDATTMDVMENEIEGMFHGIPGTFTCDGTCRVESDDKAMLSLLFGTWTFEPAEQETGADPYMVAGVAEDDFYLDFGYWIVEGPGAEYAVGTYATSTELVTTLAEEITGTAEYAGPATGLYMHKRVGADGKPASAVSGQFTALANLMATFGQAADMSIPPNMLDSITGTVSDFRNADGDMIADWTAMLMVGVDDNDAARTSNIADDGTFDGTTTGGGEWNGQFHDARVNADDNDIAIAPGAAAGVFNAHFDNGHVAGAFGATIQE